jgi:hypothetical protein
MLDDFSSRASLRDPSFAPGNDYRRERFGGDEVGRGVRSGTVPVVIIAGYGGRKRQCGLGVRAMPGIAGLFRQDRGSVSHIAVQRCDER